MYVDSALVVYLNNYDQNSKSDGLKFFRIFLHSFRDIQYRIVIRAVQTFFTASNSEAGQLLYITENI